MEDVDLIVIGAGQGGVPLAVAHAKAGKRVVLFERGAMGGSCVNYGCTPSKAFLASAHNAGRARLASAVGIDATVRVDGRAVMARVRSIRDDWHDGVEKKVAAAKIAVVRANAAFTGVRTVAGGDAEFRAATVVIDTGTMPVVPPIDGLAETPYLTNRTWFDQATLPPRVIVIGGGYIGLELGQGARRLGSAVTIVHSGSRVMEREDDDASDAVRAGLADDGVTFELGTRARSVTHDGSAFRVTLANGNVLEAEALLVATGRKPATADLNCGNSNITLTSAGYIEVDAHLKTTCDGVYALGDVAGQPAFTHVAWEDFRRIESTLAGTPRTRDDRVLSYSTFTEPQLARTGLSLDQARKRGIAASARTLALEDVARGPEWNLERGFMRLVVDDATAKIVGATFVGYEMGELIHTIGFAIELGATWHDLDRFVAIHPTFGEGLPSLARLFAAPA
ncbi:MAG: FAD-dependent oxidoreductase [Vulcanimicrobiaceae bacterium]